MYDDDSGYAMDDPKHPTFHERYAGIWDDRDKTVRMPTPHRKPKQSAVITKTGEPGREEPSALLADGRTMPMGRNMGKRYELGTMGEAEYIYDGRSGLWLFTPLENGDDI